MSNERNDSGRDPIVSDAYRDLADEKTPEHLSREVLRKAAEEGTTRYSAMRAWVRPAAWAATIGLSLALVLQLSDMPQSEPAIAPVTAPAKQDLFETKDKVERQEALAKRSRGQPQQGQPVEKVTVLNDAPVAAADAIDDEASIETNTSTSAFAPQDPDSSQAGELARVQDAAEETPVVEAESHADRPAAGVVVAEPTSAGIASVEQRTTRVTAAATLSTEATSLQSYTEGLCPAKARESAEKWFECIKAIENRAPRDLVEREYEEFREHFPEFEEPDIRK